MSKFVGDISIFFNDTSIDALVTIVLLCKIIYGLSMVNIQHAQKLSEMNY